MALTTTPRRSARLGSHCSRKHSDAEQQLVPSSSKLPPTPEPSPRSIRAQKRQKVLDASSPPPAMEARARKRKSLIADDDQHHHSVVRKKRKENILTDALTATAKISITLDTRQAGGNNLHHRHRDEDHSRNTRSSKSSKSPAKVSEPSCDPSSSSSSRMITRTMKKLSSPPASTAGSILPPTPSIQPASDPASNSTTTTTTDADSTNHPQPSSHDTDTSTTVTISAETIPLPLSKSPIDISISMSSLPISFMDVPLSMPLNLAFLNMPLPMPLSMPLNMPISTDISTTLAPSESELGFGFHPQEEFNTIGREEGKGNEKDKEGEHVFMNGERPNESTTTRCSPDLSVSSHSLNRPSSPPPLPPQSCTPCLNPISTTPRLVISTCLSDQAQPTSPTLSPTSPTSAHTYSSSPSFVNPTSPTYSSPLKGVCFPFLPGPPPQSFPSASPWQPSPSTSTSQQLPSATMSGHERRMKEWDTMAMDMADDQRQTERALEQEMGMELSLSFRNPSTGQGDELHLAQPQGQQQLEQEQDRSPLLGPAPQPSSPEPQAPYPQLTPSFPPSPPPYPSSTPSSSSKQYHKKIEYQHHQIPEWTPKVDKERSLWKLACKIRVWEITKRYTPDTIRTVVAQEAHDYYSMHGFPLGYGSVPVRPRKRRWRKMVGGAGSSSTAAAAAAGSESDCASSCSSMTPSLSPTSPTARDDEFMSEETYSFELMDDDDDIDASVGGVSGGVGLGISGMRSMEDEWRYEGFEDDDEFGFEDYDDDDDDDDDDDIYEDEVEEVDGDQTKISGNRKKKGVQSFEDQDQDPDAEGEMEIDIEPFQDPSFNAELSSPTSPGSSTSSKSKSKSRSDAAVGNEPQSFVSSFYVPSVPPHVQHMMQMQQQQRKEEQQQMEEVPALAPSSPTNPPSPSSSSTEGTPISTSDTADHTATATPDNHTPMQIHLPPASHHPHHYHPQLSSNILPLPPPRLDSVRVFILRQSEMGGLKTTGRGTPADRKRGAIWGGIGGQVVRSGSGSKRGLDDGKESESESDEENAEDEGGKRGRPRLRLMLSDHDIGSGPQRGRSRQGEGEDGAKTTLRLRLPRDTDERMPIVPAGFKCDISESSNANHDEDIHRTMPKPSTTATATTATFVATDQIWDTLLASLDDKSQPQQQGEEGTLDSSVTAADSDTTHGQLLLDLDGHRHRHRTERDPLGVGRRLGPSSPPLEGTSGMFMFDQGGDNSISWFGNGDGEGGLGKSGVGVGVVGGLVGSSGTCPGDALALEGFNFSVGPDGSSTLSYALG